MAQLLISAIDGIDMKHFVIPFFSVVAVAYFARWLRGVLVDPLRDIPGPRVARFSKLWLAREYAQGDYHNTNIRLHQQYGPVVRIAPGQYSIDDPEAAKIIYGHGSQFTKASSTNSDWYSPWGHPKWRNLFNELEPKAHAATRRKFAGAYSMSSLVGYEEFVDECSDKLLTCLREFASTSENVDMQRWLQYYAFDVVSMITFSKPIGFLDQGKDVHNFIKFLDNTNFISAVGGVFPSAFNIIMGVLQRLPGGPKGLKIIIEHVQRQIDYHKGKRCIQSVDIPADFITKILAARQTDPARITDIDVKIAGIGNIMAGSDTTSVSLSSIVANVYRHRNVLAKLRRELEEAMSNGLMTEPITFKQAQALPYLQAVIKEGLRCHPATGFTMPRVVPKDGSLIAGRYFPAGSIVGINSWVAHANNDVFGPDSQSFRPERWLEDSAWSNDQYFLTFGMGSRTCIGKNISLLEISKIVPRIVKNFDLDLEVNGPITSTNNWFVKPNNFKCYLRDIGRR